MSYNSGSSSDSSSIIGGTMGGVILILMITIVLCIVIACMRRCHRERDYKVAYNTTNTDVTSDNNPSDDVRNNNMNTDPSYALSTGNSNVTYTDPVYASNNIMNTEF